MIFCNLLACPVISLFLLLFLHQHQLFKWEFSDYSPWQVEGHRWLSSGYSRGSRAGDTVTYRKLPHWRKKHSRVLSEALPKSGGWLPTRPGIVGSAWPEFMDISLQLPRGVLFPVNLLSEIYPLRPNAWGVRDRDAIFCTQFTEQEVHLLLLTIKWGRPPYDWGSLWSF